MDLNQQIMEILGQIQDPELHRPLTELNMIGRVAVENGSAVIDIKLTIPGCPLKAKIEKDVTSAVSRIPEIKTVTINFTSMNDQEREQLRGKIMARQKMPAQLFDNVKTVIAVCSGKGGVGKSTVATNLAVAFSLLGYRVGLLDADIYGFSIPRMMGIHDQMPTVIDDMLIPLQKNGIKVISMGFFVPDDGAVLWRGPLLHKAIGQFIDDVAWGELDYLLLDLPPGTGDVTISIAQKIPKAKLLIVTTPQIAAYNVASRVGKLAERTGLPVAGIVENMSFFETADGKREYIFGQSGGRQLAETLGVTLLGEIPLRTAIREGSDTGAAYAFTEDGAGLFREIARKLI